MSKVVGLVFPPVIVGNDWMSKEIAKIYGAAFNAVCIEQSRNPEVGVDYADLALEVAYDTIKNKVRVESVGGKYLIDRRILLTIAKRRRVDRFRREHGIKRNQGGKRWWEARPKDISLDFLFECNPQLADDFCYDVHYTA